MTKTRFYLISAAVMLGLSGINHAHAYRLTITLPPRAIPAPPPPIIPVLLGSWHDGQCLLLPPGVVPFETVFDTITFQANGTFTEVIQKATGTLREQGQYTVSGSRLTLDFLLALRKPAQYEFSRSGAFLLLRPAGSGASETRTLARVQNRDAS